ANLDYADCDRVNWSGANLFQASLRYACLRFGQFFQSNLLLADLSGADVTGVNLEEAQGVGAILRALHPPAAPG
ncbi:pentapeptide repeat-containing protein, partial [Gloeomargarita sp.]